MNTILDFKAWVNQQEIELSRKIEDKPNPHLKEVMLMYRGQLAAFQKVNRHINRALRQK